MIRQRDPELAVTPAGLAAGCDNPLSVVTSAQIQTRANRHTCTCLFPGGEVAVVNVYCAADQSHAREIVAHMWPSCRYATTDGDGTHGRARPFTLLHLSKRNGLMLRFDRGQREQEGAEL